MSERLPKEPPLQSWSAWTALWLAVRDLQTEVDALRTENAMLRAEVQTLRSVPPLPPPMTGKKK